MQGTQQISLSQIRLALGNWFITEGIVGRDNQTPSVDSFLTFLGQTVAPSQHNIPDVTDPSEDEANVCISCQ